MANPRKAKRGASKTFTLKIPKFVTMPLVHNLIDRAQPLTQGTVVYDRIVVDARELTHISPVGLATLASILLFAARNGRFKKGIIHYPKKVHVRRYLSRMNFNKLLRVKEHTPVRQHRAPRSGRFRELMEVTTEDDCIRITNHIGAVLKKQIPGNRTILNNVSHCLAEVLDNIVHHADSSTNGVACAQAYRKGGAIELAIVDCGIGVRESLSKNPQYADQIPADSDALSLAVQKGVTSTPHRNSGEGLFFVAELLKRSGKMRLQSGEAVLTVGRKGTTTKAAPTWRGTLVGIRFELKRGVPIAQIFNELSPLSEDEQLPLFETPAPQT